MIRSHCCRRISATLFFCFSLIPCSAQNQGQATNLTAHNVALDRNVSAIYTKWLTEDVHWIITDQERTDFQKLATDRQRDDFVVAFWESRNPTPGSSGNKFKEEHYRRLAYVNTNFAAGVPGWKTDRGRFYITHGPPSRVEHYLRAAESNRPLPVSDDDGSRFDREVWHWDYVEGIGEGVTLKFVDTCGCGEYHLPVEPNDLRRYTPK
jgi:GWxTD domain-containing protein